MIKELFENHYEDLLEILNCLRVGVYITDGKGRTILVNDESCKTGGLAREEVIGKDMHTLEREGFVKESVTLKTLTSREPETMIQDLGDGGKVFVSAQPKFVRGKLEYVITTERDITEVQVLKDVLKERERETEKYEKEIEYLKNRNIAMYGPVVASDPASVQLVERVMRVAGLDTTVLLTGESGTGKEVYANLIYTHSKRVGKPFIKVNCAAIPENLIESEMFGYERGAFTGAEKTGKMGYFELANGGTLFLDEIGDLPINLQPKLLRALQEKEIVRIGGEKTIQVDIRLIVATNTDLIKATKEGKFRYDLYYRLSVMPIEILPLRKRKGDISPLALHFIERFNTQYKVNKKLEESAMEILEKYSWPGNVRELQNIIERSIISFDGERITRFQIDKLLFPRSVAGEMEISLESNNKTLDELMYAYEMQIIKNALETCKNASDAAKKLGMNKSTLSRRMHKYGLSV